MLRYWTVGDARRLRRFAAAVFLVGTIAGAAEPREITGVLVEPITRAPIAGQKLVLDRPPGDYSHIPFGMLIFGVPQPATIATAVTDERGHFYFATAKDRRRFLEIRVSGKTPADFRSRSGYAVEHLHDTLNPEKPSVEFDARIMHGPDGGFTSVP